MCDPTILAVASTVAGVAGSAANMMGQQSAQDEQKKQYDEWAANQQKQRQIAQAKQDQDRQIAETARNQGLQDVSADSQKQKQADEQARLSSYLQGQDQTSTQPGDTAQTATADKYLLSGQQGGDARFQNDLASKINTATADAKQRIAALAAVSSYGGSSGGLDVSNALAFQKSGMGIDMANDFRKGDLAAYGAQKAIDPLQISYTPSPIAGLANQALSFGSQGLGKMLSGAVKTV